MIKENLVSCIVPVYNGEKWLKKCIRSITLQSYQAVEILLINDGSTDNSEKICMQAQKKDNRIRYYSHSNHGVSYTRNRGIALSKGKYICFVDCDDVLAKNAIKTLVYNMESANAQLASGSIKTVSKYGAILFGFEPCILCTDTIDDRLVRFVFDMRSSSGYMAAKLYQSEIIKDNLLQFEHDIRCYEDAIFTYRYLQYCKRCAVTDKVVYYYNRMNEAAATRSFHAFRDQRYVWETVKICCQKALLQDVPLSQKNQEYVHQVVLRQFMNMCRYYANMSPDPQTDVMRIQNCYAPLLRETSCFDNNQPSLIDMLPEQLLDYLTAEKRSQEKKTGIWQILKRIGRWMIHRKE